MQKLFKIISVIVIQAFLALDFAWAADGEFSAAEPSGAAYTPVLRLELDTLAPEMQLERELIDKAVKAIPIHRSDEEKLYQGVPIDTKRIKLGSARYKTEISIKISDDDNLLITIPAFEEKEGDFYWNWKRRQYGDFNEIYSEIGIKDKNDNNIEYNIPYPVFVSRVLIDTLVKNRNILKDKVVLDAGSGDGVVATISKFLGADRVYGIDNSRAINKIAEKIRDANLPQDESEKVKFYYGDFEYDNFNFNDSPPQVLLLNVGVNVRETLEVLLEKYPTIEHVILISEYVQPPGPNSYNKEVYNEDTIIDLFLELERNGKIESADYVEDDGQLLGTKVGLWSFVVKLDKPQIAEASAAADSLKSTIEKPGVLGGVKQRAAAFIAAASLFTLLIMPFVMPVVSSAAQTRAPPAVTQGLKQTFKNNLIELSKDSYYKQVDDNGELTTIRANLRRDGKKLVFSNGKARDRVEQVNKLINKMWSSAYRKGNLDEYITKRGNSKEAIAIGKALFFLEIAAPQVFEELKTYDVPIYMGELYDYNGYTRGRRLFGILGDRIMYINEKFIENPFNIAMVFSHEGYHVKFDSPRGLIDSFFDYNFLTLLSDFLTIFRDELPSNEQAAFKQQKEFVKFINIVPIKGDYFFDKMKLESTYAANRRGQIFLDLIGTLIYNVIPGVAIYLLIKRRRNRSSGARYRRSGGSVLSDQRISGRKNGRNRYRSIILIPFVALQIMNVDFAQAGNLQQTYTVSIFDSLRSPLAQIEIENIDWQKVREFLRQYSRQSREKPPETIDELQIQQENFIKVNAGGFVVTRDESVLAEGFFGCGGTIWHHPQTRTIAVGHHYEYSPDTADEIRQIIDVLHARNIPLNEVEVTLVGGSDTSNGVFLKKLADLTENAGARLKKDEFYLFASGDKSFLVRANGKIYIVNKKQLSSYKQEAERENHYANIAKKALYISGLTAITAFLSNIFLPTTAAAATASLVTASLNLGVTIAGILIVFGLIGTIGWMVWRKNDITPETAIKSEGDVPKTEVTGKGNEQEQENIPRFSDESASNIYEQSKKEGVVFHKVFDNIFEDGFVQKFVQEWGVSLNNPAKESLQAIAINDKKLLDFISSTIYGMLENSVYYVLERKAPNNDATMYTAPEQIELSISYDGKMITVKINDNGIGMPGSEMGNIKKAKPPIAWNRRKEKQIRSERYGLPTGGFGVFMAGRIEKLINKFNGTIAFDSRYKRSAAAKIESSRVVINKNSPQELVPEEGTRDDFGTTITMLIPYVIPSIISNNFSERLNEKNTAEQATMQAI